MTAIASNGAPSSGTPPPARAVEQLSELAAGEASPAALLAALRALAPPATRLMIVGRAPDLTDLVSELTGEPPAPLGTSEVAQLEGDQLERASMKLVRIWSAGPSGAHGRLAGPETWLPPSGLFAARSGRWHYLLQ